MPRALLAVLFYLVLGIYVIRFGRSTWVHPEGIRERWFRQLPQRTWSLRLLRAISVLWVFGGWLIISQAAIALPFLREYRGLKMLMVMLVTATAATIMLISTVPRHDARKG